MNKKLSGLVAVVAGGAVALTTLSILDKREEPEVWLKSRVVSQGEIEGLTGKFEYLRTRDNGREDVFRHEARPGDRKGDVVRRFNLWDSGPNDKHEDIGSDDIRRANGDKLESIQPGPIYIRAPKKRTPQPPIQRQPTNPPTPERIREETTPRDERAEAFAVLVNNDAFEARHIGNLRNAYHTLRGKGIDPCNIYVVSGPNENTECGSTEFNLNQPPSSHGLRTALTELERRVGSNDTLLIYVTGHGDHGTVSFGNNGSVGYEEVRRFVEGLKPNLVIAISDQCYGGGIVREFERFNGRAISLSSTTDGEPTTCNYFTPYFWDAIGNNRSDFNGSGETSLREAFLRARIFYEETIAHGEPTAEDIRVADLALKRGGHRELHAPRELFATTGGINDSTIDGWILTSPTKYNQPTAPSPVSVIELNERNYYREVVQSDIPVVVDVYAWWCGPCKTLDRTIRQVAPSYVGRVKFAKLEHAGGETERVGHGPDAIPRQKVLQRYTPVDLDSYPTLLFVNRGRIVSKEVGVPDRDELAGLISSNFGVR